MIAFAYAIPVIACLVLSLAFDYAGPFSSYLWILLAGEATVAICHWIFYWSTTSCREYLGSTVCSIHYEEPWTERKERRETKTGQNGNTYTVTKIEYIHHDEKYYFITSIGTTVLCEKYFYRHVSRIWNLQPNTVSWEGSDIKGGIRYGKETFFHDLSPSRQENPDYWIPVTETGNYKNKIRCSNSIFKFEKITPEQAVELGLHDYPAVDHRYDMPCILPGRFELPPGVDKMFRKFNARYAPKWQMRLFILLFESDQEVSISEKQRAYWQGGNKNEFVLCIGLSPNCAVKWARAFSWADDTTKEVELGQWLSCRMSLRWEELYQFLLTHLEGWRRKEFKDFDYISVSLPLWQLFTIISLSLLENILALYLCLK